MSTTTDLAFEELATAVQDAVAAQVLEQERLDSVSIALEAVVSDFLTARREAEAARSHLRGLLIRQAPGHSALSTPWLLSDSTEARSRKLEDALTERGLDAIAALRPAVAPDLLDTWRNGGLLSPADAG